MTTEWIILAAVAAFAVGTLLWAGGRWLASSWEILDDDGLTEKLTAGSSPSPAVWLILRGWFNGGPRRLTYRRDERGRFRRIRR